MPTAPIEERQVGIQPLVQRRRRLMIVKIHGLISSAASAVALTSDLRHGPHGEIDRHFEQLYLARRCSRPTGGVRRTCIGRFHRCRLSRWPAQSFSDLWRLRDRLGAGVGCSIAIWSANRRNSFASMTHQNLQLHTRPRKCGNLLPHFGGRIPVRPSSGDDLVR